MAFAFVTPAPAGAAPDLGTASDTGPAIGSDFRTGSAPRADPPASGVAPRHIAFGNGDGRDSDASGDGGPATPGPPERRWYGDGYYTRREFAAYFADVDAEAAAWASAAGAAPSITALADDTGIAAGRQLH